MSFTREWKKHQVYPERQIYSDLIGSNCQGMKNCHLLLHSPGATNSHESPESSIRCCFNKLLLTKKHLDTIKLFQPYMLSGTPWRSIPSMLWDFQDLVYVSAMARAGTPASLMLQINRNILLGDSPILGAWFLSSVITTCPSLGPSVQGWMFKDIYRTNLQASVCRHLRPPYSLFQQHKARARNVCAVFFSFMSLNKFTKYPAVQSWTMLNP